MASQQISDALTDIGSEDEKRSFFKEHYLFLEKASRKTEDTTDSIGDGILIDSSRLPNSIRFSFTAAYTHNGIVSEEV